MMSVIRGWGWHFAGAGRCSATRLPVPCAATDVAGGASMPQRRAACVFAGPGTRTPPFVGHNGRRCCGHVRWVYSALPQSPRTARALHRLPSWSPKAPPPKPYGTRCPVPHHQPNPRTGASGGHPPRAQWGGRGIRPGTTATAPPPPPHHRPTARTTRRADAPCRRDPLHTAPGLQPPPTPHPPRAAGASALRGHMGPRKAVTPPPQHPPPPVHQLRLNYVPDHCSGHFLKSDGVGAF